MDELEFALERISGSGFENFSMDFLRAQGYTVHESGNQGRDGGWDARVKLGDREGIAHVSKRKDWRVKLRDDAKKVEKLEEDRGENYDLLIFVTNRHVSGEQELEMEAEIQEDYGWTLIIHHKNNILGEVRQSHPKLARRHFDIDLETDHEHLDEIENLRDERLDEVKHRRGDSKNLDKGPTVVLHIIPNGIFSKATINSTHISEPMVLGDHLRGHSETRGKKVKTFERQGSGYAIQRNDGLYESATTSIIREDHEGNWWLNGIIQQSSGVGLDAAVVLAVRDTLGNLSEMGYSGVAFVSLSLLDAKEVKLRHSTGVRRPLATDPLFGVDEYSTEFATVNIGDEDIIEDVEPMISEIWRQFGQQEGTKNIEDGKWSRGSITSNRETLLEEGDT